MNQVVLIENSPEITSQFRSYFAEQGFNFRTIPDAVDALQLIDKDKSIEMVFVNCESEGLDGLEFLRICYVNHPDLLVVLLSEKMDEEHLLMALRYRAFDFLSAPVSVAQLDNVVKRAISTFDRLDRNEHTGNCFHDVDFALTSKAADISIDFIHGAVKKMLYRYTQLNSNSVENMLLALGEAIQNAIDHGSLELDSTLKDKPGEHDSESQFDVVRRHRLKQPEYGDRKIAVHLRIEENRLLISIEDEGSGFKAEIGDEASGNVYGMGLMLIRNIVDHVYFNKTGNKITFEKKLATQTDFTNPATC